MMVSSAAVKELQSIYEAKPMTFYMAIHIMVPYFKFLNLGCYYIGETLLFTIYTHYGNFF